MSWVLTGTTITVSLPADLVWIDKSWQEVVAQVDRSLAGTLITQTSRKVGGRPITLVGDEEIWVSKELLDSLFELLNINEQMTLTTPTGDTFEVVFRYDEQAIEFEELAHNVETYNNLKIKLREV